MQLVEVTKNAMEDLPPLANGADKLPIQHLEVMGLSVILSNSFINNQGQILLTMNLCLATCDFSCKIFSRKRWSKYCVDAILFELRNLLGSYICVLNRSISHAKE